MAQQMHKGTIVGYVLVGALLLALVVGGIFVVKNYATKNNTGNETNKVVEDTVTQSNEALSSTNTDLEQALKNQASQQKQTDSPAKSSSTATTSDSSITSTSNHLPTTGPEDLIIPLIGATLLAGTAVSYVRSRSLI
ncbi:hypothetical protein IPM09_03810 [Candidatus Saccharibacteria bacterium]|nr:MAG: hypothetical protein IPM09_03810 [Candidatus Saccharibacteria bacterium]